MAGLPFPVPEPEPLLPEPDLAESGELEPDELEPDELAAAEPADSPDEPLVDDDPSPLDAADLSPAASFEVRGFAEPFRLSVR